MKRLFLILVFIFVLFLLSFFAYQFFLKKKQTSQVVQPATPVIAVTPIASPSAKINDNVFKVTRVIDGDTIELENKKVVRLIGVDSPELHHPKKPVQCFGEEAAEFTKKILEGKTVRLEKDVLETDRYKRLLRYVHLVGEGGEDEVFFNEYLVSEGYAIVATYPPDVKYVEIFLKAQEEARNNNRGLWSKCKAS